MRHENPLNANRYRPRPRPRQPPPRVLEQEESIVSKVTEDTLSNQGSGIFSCFEGFQFGQKYKLLGGFLFGLFISSSYQPVLNEPICKPYEYESPGEGVGQGHQHLVLKNVDQLPWWQSWFVTSLCDPHSQIYGFLLRFGISLSTALGIALVLNLLFAKWRNARPQYKSKYKAKVGNETWELRTSLKITKNETLVESDADSGRESADEEVGGITKEVEVEAEEALKFLFAAIEGFGRENGKLVKHTPVLEPLFQSADICLALSHLERNAVNAWPQVVGNLIQKAKDQAQDRNKNNGGIRGNEVCVVNMQSGN